MMRFASPGGERSYGPIEDAGRLLSEGVVCAASAIRTCPPSWRLPNQIRVGEFHVSIRPFEAQAEIAAKAQCVRMKRLCSAMDTNVGDWGSSSPHDSMATLSLRCLYALSST
jgi:hypothetical protein